MDPLYIEVLKQWLFFFGLMTMLLMPPIRFRIVAIQHNQNGWWYCLLGLGVSGLLLTALRATALVFKRWEPPKEYRDYISFAVLALCLAGAFVSVTLLKRNLRNKEV